MGEAYWENRRCLDSLRLKITNFYKLLKYFFKKITGTALCIFRTSIIKQDPTLNTLFLPGSFPKMLLFPLSTAPPLQLASTEDFLALVKPLFQEYMEQITEASDSRLASPSSLTVSWSSEKRKLGELFFFFKERWENQEA